MRLGKPRFTMKREFHPAYFHTLKRLLGLEKIASFSFIAEHMMFNSTIMKELLNVINFNKDVEGGDWVENVLMHVNLIWNIERKDPIFLNLRLMVLLYGLNIQISILFKL